jgi:hypothetical protein
MTKKVCGKCKKAEIDRAVAKERERNIAIIDKYQRLMWPNVEYMLDDLINSIREDGKGSDG